MAAVVDSEDAQDKKIEQAIRNALRSSEEDLAEERINNLKDRLKAIKEWQIAKSKESITLEELALFLGFTAEALEEWEKRHIQLESPIQLDQIEQNEEFIIAIDKILEEKERQDIKENLESQDGSVEDNFGVQVREKLLLKEQETPEIKAKKNKKSFAIYLGATLAAAGIGMVIAAGSVATAGALPIALGVIGAVLIVGVGLYSAKKKRARVAKILPALYAKSENARELQTSQLDSEERQKKLAKLTTAHDEKNKKISGDEEKQDVEKASAAHEKLEEKRKSNETNYQENANLIGSQTTTLPWYKKVGPKLARWSTNVAINYLATSVALKEVTAAVAEGIRHVKERLSNNGQDPNTVSELKRGQELLDAANKTLGQGESRVLGFIDRLGIKLPNQHKVDFYDYLKIEECYESEDEFNKRINRLTIGDGIRNDTLKILYTHPSTVLSLFAKNDENTIANINKALKTAAEDLKFFEENYSCLDSLQVYFPPDDNDNYERFMLVADEEPKAKQQEALFKKILVIKQSIMQANKTLQAAPESVKSGFRSELELKELKDLIDKAKPVAEIIEAQLAKLDLLKETNEIRKCYLESCGILSEFSDADSKKRAECINKATFTDLVRLLKDEHLKAFATQLIEDLEKQGKEASGVLAEFITLYNVSGNEAIPNQKKLAFFQKLNAVDKSDTQLEIPTKKLRKYFNDKNLAAEDFNKLNGQPVNGPDDFKKYVKDNEYIYNSQNVLIEQKRGVLGETQKALVLSIPEMERALGLDPTPTFKRLASKRKIDDYGVPYKPSMLFSLDYVSNLFKKAQDAFEDVKTIRANLKLSTVNISSIEDGLTKVLEYVRDPSIQSSIDNTLNVLNKMKDVDVPVPGFGTIVSSFLGKVEEARDILSNENQDKVIGVITTIKGFLHKIPPPYRNLTALDFIKKISEMSKEVVSLREKLSRLQLDPGNYANAAEIKKIFLRLKELKQDFDMFERNFQGMNLQQKVAELPDDFPMKDELKMFVSSFDTVFKEVKKSVNVMKETLDKVEFLGDFPLDDFLYVCSSFKEFKGVDDFQNIIGKFPTSMQELEKFKNLKIHIDKLLAFGKARPTEMKKLKELLISSGIPMLSVDNLTEFSTAFDQVKDISDNISVVVDVFNQVKDLKGISADVEGLAQLMKTLEAGVKGLSKVTDDAKRGAIIRTFEEAKEKFEMLNNFKGSVEKFLAMDTDFKDLDLGALGLPKMAELAKIVGITNPLKGIESRLQQVEDSLGGDKVENDLSVLEENGRVLEKSINKLLSDPNRGQKRAKKKSAEATSESLDLKAIELDEIIKRFESSKTGADNLLLPRLRAQRATIAVLNAIRMGDPDVVGPSLAELSEKAFALKREIQFIVDELNTLKEFGSTAFELGQIELLKKQLVLKEQDLKNIKLSVFELKRMKEAFSPDLKIDTVNFNKPPISDAMHAFEVDKLTVESIIKKAEKLDEKEMASAVEAIEFSNVSIKLGPLAETIRNSYRKDIKSELNGLIKQAEVTSAKNVDMEKPLQDRLLKLQDMKRRLLALKQLNKAASEMPDVDFTQSSYLSALQSLGLSGDVVKSVVENAKRFPRESMVDIDGALDNLDGALAPLKDALFEKNAEIIKASFGDRKLSSFLHLITGDSSNLDDIVSKWQKKDPKYTEKDDQQKNLTQWNFSKLWDAAKNAENLADEPAQQDFLNSIGCSSFSDIYDFINMSAIVRVQRVAVSLEGIFSDPRYASKPFVTENKELVDDLIERNNALMNKLHDYHSFVKISNQLKNRLDAAGGKLTKADFKDIEHLKKLHLSTIGLEKELESFLKAKEELIPPSRPPLPQVDSPDHINARVFLQALDKFYALNNPQAIHQNIASAESLYQQLQANVAQPSKSMLHHFGQKSSGSKSKTEAVSKKPKDKPVM